MVAGLNKELSLYNWKNNFETLDLFKLRVDVTESLEIMHEISGENVSPINAYLEIQKNSKNFGTHIEAQICKLSAFSRIRKLNRYVLSS